MHARRCAPFVVFVAACAAAPTPAATTLPPPLPAAAPIVAPAPSPSEPAPSAPPPLPAAVPIPPPACVLESASFFGPFGGIELRLREGGPVFAKLLGGSVSVRIAEGPVTSLGVELTEDLFVLGAVAAPSAIAVHPARPFVLQGFAAPMASAKLALRSAAKDGVEVALDLGPDVDAADAPVRATEACRDLSLDVVRYDELTAVPGAEPPKKLPERWARVPSGARAALSVAPREPKVATIAGAESEGSEDLVVLARQGGFTRVVGWFGEGVVFGWIRSAELRDLKEATGFGTGSGRPALRSPGVPARAYLCDADVPLVAAAGGESAVVGVLRAHTPIGAAMGEDGWAKVELYARGAALVHGASLVVRNADLAGCRPPP